MHNWLLLLIVKNELWMATELITGREIYREQKVSLIIS